MRETLQAAENYEKLFVPALFGEWAPRVASAAGVEAGWRVLDVACGTGVLAREAARRTGSPELVAGLDVAPGMLAVAAQLEPAIEWRQGMADELPFLDRRFDAVVSQFGLMFFPDRPRALREMLRVLKPAGHIAVAVWDSLENVPGFAALVTLLDRVAGRPAGDALRAPFCLGDAEELASLLVSAGAGEVDVATIRGSAKFPDIRTMVEAEVRGWLPLMGVALEEDRIETILREADGELADFVTPAGALEFAAPAHIAVGVKPAR
jgi:SAM-dependent methyltransferase